MNDGVPVNALDPPLNPVNTINAVLNPVVPNATTQSRNIPTSNMMNQPQFQPPPPPQFQSFQPQPQSRDMLIATNLTNFQGQFRSVQTPQQSLNMLMNRTNMNNCLNFGGNMYQLQPPQPHQAHQVPQPISMNVMNYQPPSQPQGQPQPQAQWQSWSMLGNGNMVGQNIGQNGAKFGAKLSNN